MSNRNRRTPKAIKPGKGIEYRYVEKKDLRNRLYSFMLDLIVMLSPMMIWNIILLMVLGSLLSIAGIFIVTIGVAVLMIFSIFFLNRYVAKQTKGQSLGMQMYGFRIIDQRGRKANQRQVWMRELLGCDIPFVVLMVFFNIFGVMAYWILNGIVILVDKQHRSIIDFLTRTCVIVLVSETETNKTETVSEPETVLPIEKVSYNNMDLRIHSNFSNKGAYNVEEIFQEARKKGIHTISITDTNTAKANAIAEHMSNLYKVNYVSGIEIDCNFHGQRTRILGYFIDYQNELYLTIENESLLHEKNASIERVRKFERYLGIPINIEYLLKNNRFQQIPGDMIARHVLNDPKYAECEILKPYLYGKMEHPYHQLNQDYFGVGKPCHVNVKYPEIKDVLDVISLTDGIAVLANPLDVLHDSMALRELVAMGVQGIEVFQPQHSRRDMADLLKLTKEYHLFITCGSNYYKGKQGGIGECNCPVEAEVMVDMLLKAKLKK